MNKLVKITDVIDFGSQKGDQFLWLYRLHITYLEWLIKETEYCFEDLSEFYKLGKIRRLKPTLSKEKTDSIIEEMRNNPSVKNNPKLKLLTIHNLHNLVSKKILLESDFDEVEYEFSIELNRINLIKRLNAEPYYSNKFLPVKKYKHNFFYDL